MSLRTTRHRTISHVATPSMRPLVRGLKMSLVFLFVFVVSFQFVPGNAFADSSLILIVSPASFNGNTDCSYTSGQGWTCTETLGRGDTNQQNLNWAAHSSGIHGVSFNPQGGSLPPGGTQYVTITVPDTVCPTRAVFTFSGPNNSDQVPWNCGGPLLTLDTTSFTAGVNCPAGQGGWTCSANVGESSSSQGSLKWSANTIVPGVTFTPASGTLTPGATTLVSIFVPSNSCSNGKFNFVGKNSNVIHVPWNCYTPPPPPVLTVNPTTLYPLNCTLNGSIEQCSVSFGETLSSKGTVNWSSSSTLSGVTFTPSKGTLSPGETISVAISVSTCQNGTFTFSGNKGVAPITVAWKCTTPAVLTVTPTALNPTNANCSGGVNNPQCTVTLGETPDSQGSLNWSASSNLADTTFTPQSGTISQGGTQQVTIAAILCKNGTFTFAGPTNSVPVSWSCALPHGSITEYPIPTANSYSIDITEGADGNLWFTENSGKIGRINPATGAFTEYPVSGTPGRITAGADGNLWFTDSGNNAIGRIVPGSGMITEFPIPTANSSVGGITLGADGNVWFVEHAANKIGRITPAGVITEFSVPSAGGPAFITAGPDGNLWFTETSGNEVGTINPTSYAIQEYTIPTSNSSPDGITAGPDGNLWFTEYFGNKIGQITPSGTITEFTLASGTHPAKITTGSDGNLWFTENSSNKIGQITTTGTLTEYPLAAQSYPDGITAGPDGNLWFVETGTNKIGRIVP